VRALALVSLAIVAVLGRSAAAEETYKAKKDRERAAKSAKHDPITVKVGIKPTKLVNLYNQWTHDWLAIEPEQLPTLSQVDRFLRDHFTNEMTQMDKKLIEVVVGAAKQFKADVVTVVSGFRHPKFNLMLRKKGRQVARDSQHTHGNAVDFMIAKVPVKKLHEWAKAQKLGGVGIYLSSGFVHMDTGPIRFWSGE
jgi:uncharacterized protein YcbK (DUF882 family)